MLMNYACANGHREVIWNSRDGVTPFGCKCSACGIENMLHDDWSQDVYAPDHKLANGQRFWRDGTPDEAEAIMRKRIERYRDKHPIPVAKAQALIQEARDGTASEFQPGWPMLSVAS